MKPNTPLESLLSSWTPRRPSDALKRRLFGSAAGTDPAPRRPAHPGAVWLGLMPVAGAAALVLMAGAQPGSRALAGGSNDVATAVVLAHQTQLSSRNAPTVPADLPLASFAWTNTNPAPSTNASFNGPN